MSPFMPCYFVKLDRHSKVRKVGLAKGHGSVPAKLCEIPLIQQTRLKFIAVMDQRILVCTLKVILGCIKGLTCFYSIFLDSLPVFIRWNTLQC